jgi:hypothetical protein
MPCKICESPDRGAIEALIRQSVSFMKLSKRFPFSKSLLHLHSQTCMKRTPGQQEKASPDLRARKRSWLGIFRRALRGRDISGQVRAQTALDEIAQQEHASVSGGEPDVQIKVVYDDETPGFAPLTSSATRHYCAALLLSECQQPDLCEDETFLAIAAVIVTRLRNEKLPPELQREVDEKVRLCLEGSKKGKTDGTSDLD